MVGFIRFIGILTVAAGIGLYLLLTIIGEWRAGVECGGMTVLVGSALILTTVRALQQAQFDVGNVERVTFVEDEDSAGSQARQVELERSGAA